MTSKQRPNLLALLTILVLVLPFLGAGTCGGESVCEDDRTGCKSHGSSFTYLESCELTGDLQVEVGHGESAFALFADGELPTPIQGSQGGQHTFLGFRVLNADLTKYDSLKISLRIDIGPKCSEDEAAGYPSCSVAGDRELVLGGSAAPALRVTEAGAIEEYGLLVFMGGQPLEKPARVIARIEDPCRRTGEAIHVVE